MTNGIMKVGRLVSSKAGRDKDHYFLVMDILNESFVRVVDGVKRKVENPKRKNIKHLQFHDEVITIIAEKINRKERVTDAEVRQAIEGLVGVSDERFGSA
ncbi:MAG: KOW domain-containing RNA-binding protein [Clostridia bacterium]|nr:KOW domain-containing RNA-binding protein [Clostridia bacterium]